MQLFSYWAQKLFFFLGGWCNQKTTFMQTHTHTFYTNACPHTQRSSPRPSITYPYRSLPRTLFSAFPLPSHSIFYTPLCLLCLCLSLSLCITHCQQVLKPIAFQLSSLSPFFFLFCHFVLLLFFFFRLLLSYPPITQSVHLFCHAECCLPIYIIFLNLLCTPLSLLFSFFFLLLPFCPLSA